MVRARHSFSLEAYRTGGDGGRQDNYFGSYEFLPSKQPYRAQIVTPKPLINGIQTAKVVTKDDNSTEEIDVEKLGEIYVRFHWDRKRSVPADCALRRSGRENNGAARSSPGSARRPSLSFSKAIRTVRW